jgi:putative transposase
VPDHKINGNQHYLWRFLGTHAAVSNLFNLGRHLVRAEHYRDLRTGAFPEWERAVA